MVLPPPPVVTTAPTGPTEPLAPVASSPPDASGGTCLMWYACGCNVGCAKVDLPRSALKAGMSVRVASGINAGERGFVERSRDASGAEVFSLTHQAPGGIQVCTTARDALLFGYGCVANRSGALDAHACDDACR